MYLLSLNAPATAQGQHQYLPCAYIAIQPQCAYIAIQPQSACLDGLPYQQACKANRVQTIAAGHWQSGRVRNDLQSQTEQNSIRFSVFVCSRVLLKQKGGEVCDC